MAANHTGFYSDLSVIDNVDAALDRSTELLGLANDKITQVTTGAATAAAAATQAQTQALQANTYRNDAQTAAVNAAKSVNDSALNVQLSNTYATNSQTSAGLSSTSATQAAASAVSAKAAVDSLSAPDGATLISFTPAGTLSPRNVQSKLRELLSVKDFGAKGDGSSDDYAAIKGAIDYIRAQGGGNLLIPPGRYMCSSEIGISPTSSGWQNLNLIGSGSGSTSINFTNAAVGTDGIKVIGWGGRVNLRGFTILNAKLHGLELNPTERGTDTFISRVSVEDLIIDGCGTDGIRCTQTYMCSFRDVESRNNGGYGFNLRGSHTSMTFNRCWAGGDAPAPQGGNALGGWFMNGLVYSSFESCSSDNNQGPGWIVKSTAGLTMNGCGAEANKGAGWLVVSDDSDIGAIPVPGINGLVLDGCFAVNNGFASASTPNFLQFQTGGTRAGDMIVRGCNEIRGSTGSSVSVALVGNGGMLTLEEEGNHFSGTRTKTGNVYVTNRSVTGRSAIARLSADTSVANATMNPLAFSVLNSNNFGATLSNGGIVIPANVNRVRISGGTFWADNSVGSRLLTFYKNGLAFYGSPSQKIPGAGFTGVALQSAIVEVVPGDVITAIVFQNSGASLNVVANQNTYLAVEAMG